MCGIIGYISTRPHGLYSRDLDLVEQMLIFNMVRGKDSTGVFCRKGNSDIIGTKTASHPLHLFETDQWSDFRKEATATGRFVIGHGRAATRGEVKNENAHPFIENNIILVHNGTLARTKNITDVNTEVDSHAIAHALSEKSPQDVIKELDGAFALVWFNTENNTLHAVRNDQRPLCILTDDNDGYIICSEEWIGGIPAARQGRKIRNVKQVPPGVLVTWNAVKRNEMSTEQVSVRLQEEEYSYGAYTGYGGYRKAANASTASTATKDAVDAEAKETNFTPGSSGTPKEITRLRAALTCQAQTKLVGEASRSCVLTHAAAPATSPKTGNPTTASTGTGSPSEEERAIERTRSIQTTREDLRVGTPVLVKLLSINMHDKGPSGRMKYMGKIREPGKEMVDCIGWLPRTTSLLELDKFLDHMQMGLIANVTHTTNGGTTVLLNTDLFPVDMTEVYEGSIPSSILWRAVDHNVCDCCQRKVKLWEAKFTDVRLKGKHGEKTITGGPLNVIEMTCADCLQEKMVGDSQFKQQFKDKYEKARDANEKENTDTATGGDSSVSDGKSERTSTSRKNGNVIELSSSKTLH